MATRKAKTVKKKMSENVAFHRQSLQMMETGVLIFQAGGTQLVVAKEPNWQGSR